MQLISPPWAVLEIAPAKVLHGAVRLHGLASSPTPETHVRVACADAAAGTISATSATNRATLTIRRLVTITPGAPSPRGDAASVHDDRGATKRIFVLSG